MEADPELAGETKAWFTKSAGDLRAARTLLAATPPLIEEAAFHCQQAVEKALKGFLTWHRRPFRKTHNLEEIGRQAIEIAPAIAHVVEEAIPLSEYASKFRYPGGPYEPTEAEVAEAMATAERTVAAVLAQIPAVPLD